MDEDQQKILNNLYHLSELLINRFHLRKGALGAYRELPLPARFILLAITLKPFNTMESESALMLSKALQGYAPGYRDEHIKYHEKHVEDIKSFYDKYVIQDGQNE